MKVNERRHTQKVHSRAHKARNRVEALAAMKRRYMNKVLKSVVDEQLKKDMIRVFGNMEPKALWKAIRGMGRRP